MRFWRWLGLVGPDDDELTDANTRALQATVAWEREQHEHRKTKMLLVASKRELHSARLRVSAIEALADPRKVTQAMLAFEEIGEALSTLRSEIEGEAA
jgi:hypothetical protein